MLNRTGAADWPLVGRTEELDLLRRLRSAPAATSAVISGPAGVGKSRLARTALADAARQGWATLEIRGSAGFAAVPLGPFRTVLELPASSDLTELTDAVARDLTGRRSAKGLLVLADDCQDLDDASAGLLHQLVAAGVVVAMITTRSGTRPPQALTDLWKDGRAERVELQNLSRRETAELLAAGLGGAVQDSGAERIWHVTAGNPLSLREVVLSSLETGALSQVEGEWRWSGEWATGSRLQEVVEARLGRLDPDELTALEMLALAGSLPLDVVTGLTTERAVEGLEARSLVTTERNGRRLELSIAHRLHAEVLRGRLAPLQQRSIRRSLADALTAAGARRGADQVRLACWSLESGIDVDPVTLSRGATASLFGIGQAISGRLKEIIPDIEAETPAVPQDFQLALRLARAAYDSSGGVAEGVSLANTYAWTGDTEKAEAVLAEVAARAERTDDRLRLALALAWIRFWGHSHVDEARAGLTAAVEGAEGAEGGCDRVLLADTYQELAGIALNTARPAEALAYAERSALAQGVELNRSVGAVPAAAALTFLGRRGDALALVDEAVPAANEGGHPLTVATLLFTRAGTLARNGDVEEGRTLIEWLREVAIARELLDATANFGVLLGEILLMQGRLASAGRVFRDSSGLLAERDVLGYRPWALAGLARARALAGEEDAATAALEEARQIQPVGRHYDMTRFLAEVELHTLAGRFAAAVEAAGQAVDWARAAGMPIEEARALDTWVRIEPTAALADRLAEVATTTDSRLVAVMAAHARAAVDGDPDALLEAAASFAAMTTWPLAAEAASAAARILDREGQVRAAQAASRVATSYRDRCEGVRPSPTDALAGPAPLTRRENQIAALAAGGRSNREIAERMFLSPRTVENHLYHAYVKLGVTDRAGLGAALAGVTAPSSE